MYRIRTTAVAFAAAIALGSLAATTPGAVASDSPTPCATQQTHVDRATAKLADITVKFAAHPTQKNLKAKKAQVQRLAHATARLDTCLAAQPS